MACYSIFKGLSKERLEEKKYTEIFPILSTCFFLYFNFAHAIVDFNMKRRFLIYEFTVCLPRIVLHIDGFLTNKIYLLLTKRFKPKHELVGKCKKRGVCCRSIGIMASPHIFNYSFLNWLVVRWYSYIYNFHHKGSDPHYGVMVFRCKYLTATGQCSIHWRRPYLCRNYPNTSHFKSGRTLPGCGFKFK